MLPMCSWGTQMDRPQGTQHAFRCTDYHAGTAHVARSGVGASPVRHTQCIYTLVACTIMYGSLQQLISAHCGSHAALVVGHAGTDAVRR